MAQDYRQRHEHDESFIGEPLHGSPPHHPPLPHVAKEREDARFLAGHAQHVGEPDVLLPTVRGSGSPIAFDTTTPKGMAPSRQPSIVINTQRSSSLMN